MREHIAHRDGNFAHIDLPYDVLSNGLVPKSKVTVLTTMDDVSRRVVVCVIECEDAPNVKAGNRCPLAKWTDFYRQATEPEIDRATGDVRLTEGGES